MVSNLLHGIEVLNHPHFLLAKVGKFLDDRFSNQGLLQGLACVLVSIAGPELMILEVDADLPFVLSIPLDESVGDLALDIFVDFALEYNG